MSIIIRRAKAEEAGRLLELYQGAKRFMEEHGNRNQWTGDDAITPQKLEGYLERDQLYAGEEEGELLFAFVYIQGPDPTYGVITQGNWLNDEYYGTVHRLAGSPRVKGVVKRVTAWALEQNPNLRIDTHHDNIVMQNALDAAGFTRCGIIFLENGDPRIAYQKVR